MRLGCSPNQFPDSGILQIAVRERAQGSTRLAARPALRRILQTRPTPLSELASPVSRERPRSEAALPGLQDGRTGCRYQELEILISDERDLVPNPIAVGSVLRHDLINLIWFINAWNPTTSAGVGPSANAETAKGGALTTYS